MGLRMMTGVILGIGFYLLNQLMGSLNSVIDVPPLVAALSPTLVFALLGGVVILKTN
jgi:lipopolysaccharide export system permease protein